MGLHDLWVWLVMATIIPLVLAHTLALLIAMSIIRMDAAMHAYKILC